MPFPTSKHYLPHPLRGVAGNKRFYCLYIKYTALKFLLPYSTETATCEE